MEIVVAQDGMDLVRGGPVGAEAIEYATVMHIGISKGGQGQGVVQQGLLNKEIAAKYNISIRTVITHRKNIARKTGIKTIAGLTAYAILNNII